MSYNFWLITNRVKSGSKKKSRVPCHLEKMVQCTVISMVLRHNPGITEFKVPFPKSWVNLAVRIIYALPLSNVANNILGAFAVLDYLGYEHDPALSFNYIDDHEWSIVVESLKGVPQTGTEFEECLWSFTLRKESKDKERQVWSLRVALAFTNILFVIEKIKKEFSIWELGPYSDHDLQDLANICHVCLCFSQTLDNATVKELLSIDQKAFSQWRLSPFNPEVRHGRQGRIELLVHSLIDEFPIPA